MSGAGQATKVLEVAVLGLGSMGYGMAGALARAGHQVRAFDVRADSVAQFTAEYPAAVPAATPEGAAEGADAIVVGGGQRRPGETGAARRARRRSARRSAARSSSTAPTMKPGKGEGAGHLRRGEGLALSRRPDQRRGAARGRGRAHHPGLRLRAAFAAARPALDAMAARLYELATRPGTGAAFKMVNQLLAGVHIAAACEAIPSPPGWGSTSARSMR